MKLACGLLVAHVVALVFGLAGMLIALPNPQLWAADPLGRTVFQFGMQYAGALHILFGAAAMLAYSRTQLGWRKTLIFLSASTLISLASELIGTGTGWPFGNYAYEDGLGWKVLDRVPYTIPLSWYYVGLASYLLAERLVPERRARSGASVLAVLGGAWLLMGWDLVLDPAMAHESLPLKFWVWSESGPYFGMPLKNLAAWFATGLVFMAVSRWLWGGPAASRPLPVAIPLLVYAANLVFAAVISLSVGLWEPVVLAVVWAVAPLPLARAVGPSSRRESEAAVA
jgi:uncharacterized membrane protein